MLGQAPKETDNLKDSWAKNLRNILFRPISAHMHENTYEQQFVMYIVENDDKGQQLGFASYVNDVEGPDIQIAKDTMKQN